MKPISAPCIQTGPCGGQIVGIRINGRVITIKNHDGTTEECTMEIGGNLTYAEIPTDMKRCSKCKRVLMATMFYRRRSGPLVSRCRECLNTDRASRAKVDPKIPHNLAGRAAYGYRLVSLRYRLPRGHIGDRRRYGTIRRTLIRELEEISATSLLDIPEHTLIYYPDDPTLILDYRKIIDTMFVRAGLAQIDKDILLLHYFEDKTLDEIAKIFNKSRERIRQIETRAMLKCRMMTETRRWSGFRFIRWML